MLILDCSDMVPRIANYYSDLLENLAEVEWHLERDEQSLLPATKDYADNFMNLLSKMEQESKDLGFDRTLSRLKRLYQFFASNPTDAGLAVASIKAVREALQDDLKVRIVFVPTDEQAKYYDNPKLFGDKVFEVFEAARVDIWAAGNCYATDNFTACVFHLMRVAEHGMRALAIDLKIKKVGKHPLAYSEWGPVCGALATKIKTLQNKPGRGPKKAALLKRYANAASQADYINEIWRKDVSHARQPYNGPEALSVLTRVREFMQSLTELNFKP